MLPYESLVERIQEEYTKLTNYLVENKKTITTMESCTSGIIASLITDTEGSSAVFKGSFVTYCNSAKIKAGVPEKVIQAYGVYSKETAVEMAKACQKQFRADIGIGVTGTFSNKDPANDDSIPGTVYFAIIHKKTVQDVKIKLPSGITRYEAKLWIADEIYKELEEILKI